MSKKIKHERDFRGDLDDASSIHCDAMFPAIQAYEHARAVGAAITPDQKNRARMLASEYLELRLQQAENVVGEPTAKVRVPTPKERDARTESELLASRRVLMAAIATQLTTFRVFEIEEANDDEIAWAVHSLIAAGWVVTALRVIPEQPVYQFTVDPADTGEGS